MHKQEREHRKKDALQHIELLKKMQQKGEITTFLLEEKCKPYLLIIKEIEFEERADSQLDEMQLPKVNLIRQQSDVMLMKLTIAISEAITKVETENNYKFEPYEKDYLLLQMVMRRHENYVSQKFGIR